VNVPLIESPETPYVIELGVPAIVTVPLVIVPVNIIAAGPPAIVPLAPVVSDGSADAAGINGPATRDKSKVDGRKTRALILMTSP